MTQVRAIKSQAARKQRPMLQTTPQAPLNHHRAQLAKAARQGTAHHWHGLLRLLLLFDDDSEWKSPAKALENQRPSINEVEEQQSRDNGY